MAGTAKQKTRKPMKLKVRKGDTVRVVAGKDRGKEGEVLRTMPSKGKVMVHQVNVIKKAMRSHPQKNPQGGILEMPAPLDISNVRLICPRCSKITKVVYAKDKEGRTSRKCRKCGELIDG